MIANIVRQKIALMREQGIGVFRGSQVACEEEWKCPACGNTGTYYELRHARDSGVDSCPQCSTEVECIDDA